MKPIGTFSVIPSLPAPIERLRNIADNLRWAWSHDGIDLFRRLDRNLWETSGHNPYFGTDEPGRKRQPGQLFVWTAAPCARSGLHGFTFRVRPQHLDLSVPFVPGLICWADGALFGRSST